MTNETNSIDKLDKMKMDIARETKNITWKQTFFNGAGTVIGGGIGLVAGLAIPGAQTLTPALALGGASIGASVGTKVANLMTIEQRTALEIDKDKLLASKANGTNFWKGYREEVLDAGMEIKHGLPAAAFVPQKNRSFAVAA